MSKPIMVPNSELQASVGDILDGEVVPTDGLLPSGAGGPPTDASLLLPSAWLTWQQVAFTVRIRKGCSFRNWKVFGLFNQNHQSSSLLFAVFWRSLRRNVFEGDNYVTF